MTQINYFYYKDYSNGMFKQLSKNYITSNINTIDVNQYYRIDLTKSFSIGDNRYNLLQIALKCSEIDIIKILLNDDRIVPLFNMSNHYKETPFFLACKRGMVDVVKLLLHDERFTTSLNSKNYCGNSPLWIAHKEGHHDVVKLLLQDQRIEKDTNVDL